MGKSSFFSYFYVFLNDKCMRFFTFLFLIISFAAKAQNTCTTLGQTPPTSFPVCVTASLSQQTLPTACSNGTVFVPICSVDGSGTVYDAIRPFWYNFTCYQSGSLIFTITPVNGADDYDWQIYDVTGININTTAFLTNGSLVLAANWTGVTGSTGASATGTGNITCASGSASPFSASPNLIAGHDYLLLISNFSPSQQGYSLTFGAGTAILVDPLAPSLPLMTTATSLCGTAIKVKTNKKVKCNTLATNASDFSIIAPDGITVITPASALAANCSGGFSFDSLIINMGTQLTPGTYKVRIQSGTDGNTLRDICDNLIPVNQEISFVVDPLPPAPTVTTPINLCQNITATALTATGTGLLWYTTATGGTGTATAPTPVTTTVGLTLYYVSQTIAGCEGPRVAVTVNVNAAPAAPTATTPITYCQNIAAAALTATGTALLWYPTATGGVGSTTAPTPNTTTAGTFNFYVTQTVSGCQSTRTQIDVNVIATPAAPIVTSPITLCQGVTATGLTAIGTNLLWYANATGGTGTITIPFPPTATLGGTTYYVSQTVNGCEGSRAAIVVNVIAPPAAPSASTPITYCQGNTATALTTTNGINLLWYTVASGGTGSATAPIPSTATASSVIYYVSQTVGTCESQRTAILVIVKATPAAPIANSPIPYCQGVTAIALTATGTGLLWYTVPTNGTGTATAPIPTTTTGGITTYYVSQTVNGCESARTPIVVNVTATPAAPTVTAAVGYCQGNTATVLSAGGTSLLWYTTATGGTGNTTAPTPSTTGLGSTNYYVSQSTNGCEGPRALIVVTVSTTPAAPFVNATVAYCQGATATALMATGSGLLWYTQATSGTGTAIAPTPSTTSVGTTIYYVSQTFGTCEGPRASITVTINSTPIAPTVPAATVNYCVGATATALTASGINLLWYTVATGGIGTSIAPTPSTTTGGNTNYYVSQTTGICEGPRTQVTVVITAIPPAPAVISPIVYCQGTTATALTATGTNLLWYSLLPGGPSSSTAPTPLTTNAGSTNYYVSQSINNCASTTTNIVVVVNTTPILPTVTTPVTYCQNAPTSPLIAGGTNLQWFTTATGGTASTITPTVSSATAGTFTFYVAQKLGNCEGPRAAIVVNITATPAAPTVVSPLNICPNDIAQPLTATGANLLWYTSATGGVGTTIAPTPNTAIFPSTNTYYVSQTSSAITGSCEGPRAAIVVIIDNPLSINIGRDSTICEGQSVKLLPVVTPAGATYEWRTMGIPLSTIDDRFIKDATVNPIDTGVYILKATLGGCFKEDTVNINVIWKPAINAGLTKAICLDSSILLKAIVSHNSSDSISYLWSPTDSLATPDALQTLAYPTKTTFYTISFQTKPIYGCDFKGSSSVKLVVQKIDKAFAGNDTIAVKGVPHVLQGSGGLNYTWSSPSGINISNPFSQKAFVTLNDDAQFYLKVTDAIGCEGRDTIFVKVYNGPTFYVPNSFTPNGDGLNDIFRAIPVGIANTYFRIFNRTGQLMFETTQYLKGWDGTFNGKPQPIGTYVWVVSGTDRDYKKVEMKGTVNLIR
jgi:large repetitive protein